MTYLPPSVCKRSSHFAFKLGLWKVTKLRILLKFYSLAWGAAPIPPQWSAPHAPALGLLGSRSRLLLFLASALTGGFSSRLRTPPAKQGEFASAPASRRQSRRRKMRRRCVGIILILGSNTIRRRAASPTSRSATTASRLGEMLLG